MENHRPGASRRLIEGRHRHLFIAFTLAAGLSSGAGSNSGGTSGGSSGSSSGSSSSSSPSSGSGSSSGASSGSSSGGSCLTSGIPAFDHVVLVIEENHNFGEIIGSNNGDPYINYLANRGVLFTNSFAITHPSEPNYFALFTGSTQGISDDNNHNFPGPSLVKELASAGKTFVGYIETSSPRKHNPWESFSDSQNVEQNFSSFPSDFTQLPSVSWVIPDMNDDMHDGTVQQGDQWIQSNMSAYATWAAAHNSLLIVTWDEDDNGNNQIATIFYGANLKPGRYSEKINHYNTLATIETMFGVPLLNNAATAAPIADVWNCSSGSSSSSSGSGLSGSSSSSIFGSGPSSGSNGGSPS